MNRISIKAILIGFSLILGCDEEEGTKFEGILLRDPSNQDMGTIGKRDLNDWQNDGELSKRILDLLATTPDHDLTGTADGDIFIFGAYPNPVANEISFQARVNGGPCLFEYVIVNEKMKVLFSGSQVGIDQAYNFDVSNDSKFPNNTVLRMYYSFSNEEDKNFYVGHGDILICHASKCRGFASP